MSVIGIDFGNDSCYIAVARQGGIETIANDYSLRSTPSCVAFGEKNRILGVAAKNQMTTNMKNTLVGFKRLIGRNFRDPLVQQELPSLPYRLVEGVNGECTVVVQYLVEEHRFNPTQITAMLFTKLKHTAENALGIKVNDVVIGVPCYFTDGQRRAMLDAAVTAGLNVLRLLNETTATALAYGIYKQDLPAPEEKPRNVFFVDSGHSCLQVCAAAFHKGKLKMLATSFDHSLGGRDIDILLARHFAEEFKTRYKIDVYSSPRAWVRLLNEVEKLKKQMSANSTELPINIECFMDDKDVSGKMKRAIMEDMAAPLMERVEATLRRCLVSSSLKMEEVHSVEIVGGSTRIPMIKQLIEKVFNKHPSTTLNQDEAVSRGCALQCAMLSPTFKVREFAISDVQPYSIRLVWQDEVGQQSDMEVFPQNHQVPFSKMLTFFRREPFVLEAQYAQPLPCPDPNIGHFTIQGVAPTPEGESQKVKVKVRVNLHGLFTVASATLTEKKETIEEPDAAMDTSEAKPSGGEEQDTKAAADSTAETNDQQQQQQQGKADSAEQMETDKAAESPAAGKGEGEKKMRKVVKTVELPVVQTTRGPNANQLNILVEREAQMVQADKLENERINSKNAVEEYVYDVRGRIYDDLEKFIAPDDRDKLSLLLEDTENWLYDEGEDCQKQVYLDKLELLKNHGEPIKARKREFEERPQAFQSFLAALQSVRKAIDLFKAGDEKYNHLDSADMEKVEKIVREKQEWVDRNMGLCSATGLHLDPPVTSSQIWSEKSGMDAVVNPIMNKPKPKPKTEEPPPTPKKEEEGGKEGTEQQSNGPKVDKQSSNEPSAPSTESMDVD